MQNQEKEVFRVGKILELDELPSGSGLTLVQDKLFAIGDDSPYLFELNLAYQIRQKHLLLPAWAQEFKIPKSHKPDFEALCTTNSQSQPQLLIFGSGSKSPERDSLLVVSLQNPAQHKKYSLTHLYDLICQQEGYGRERLNLEGAAMLGDELWLFNRGSNALISLSWPQLLQQLTTSLPQENGTAKPALALNIYPIELPQIAGKLARFSGACLVPGTDKVLVTASVEDTENWIDDGEVLGSFVGLLDRNSVAEQRLLRSWPIADAQGNALIEKLESIEVLEWNGDTLHALGITDNDKGSSKLLELQLSGASTLFKTSQNPE